MSESADIDIRRYRANWQEEIDSAAEYRAMAENEPRGRFAKVFLDLASMEEDHARFWAEQLRRRGQQVGPARPSWRARMLCRVARRFGARLVLPTVASREYAGRDLYATQPETAQGSMADQERSHARVLTSLLSDRPGAKGSVLARLEGRHRNLGTNALRAAVLGANDGLSSNLSLVMGVAGASASPHALLIAGLAGLLAGAFSMALGEWISVTSSRELARRELRIEADEVRAHPEDEREELELIYRAKGLEPRAAKDLSSQLIRDPRAALDVLSREELGIDPEGLGGSALVAAATSFVLFALGAVVPVLPLLFPTLAGRAALLASIGVSAVGLAVLGAGISVFTGRPVWVSAGRQLLLGLAAAAATFGLGRLVGTAIGG